MKTQNRVFRNQPDYLFQIVRRPAGWRPSRLDDVPPEYELVSTTPVASFPEARDDLLRCNRLALRKNMPVWAVIQSPGAGL